MVANLIQTASKRIDQLQSKSGCESCPNVYILTKLSPVLLCFPPVVINNYVYLHIVIL